MDSKLCGGCQTVKPLSDYYQNSSRVSGYQAWCKRCQLRDIKARNARNRAAILNHYGSRCVCCGATDELHIDHHYGRAVQGRQTPASGIGLYNWLIANDFPPGFQVLCGPCNRSKGPGFICCIHSRWLGPPPENMLDFLAANGITVLR